MPIDPKANEEFHAKQVQPFKVGERVWVNGVEFFIVTNEQNTLVLRPVTGKIS